MIQCHALTPDVRLVLEPGAALEPALSAAVDRLWEAETAARGAGLFDGQIYSLRAHAPGRLTLEAGSYRRLIAARRDADVARRLALRPMGVTGLLVSPDGMVLGRRSGRVHTEPGRWEPAPSGMLDRLDWRATVLEELREELGLGPDSVEPPQAIALVEDGATGVCDILSRLVTRLGSAEILAAWRAGGTHEYDDLAVIGPEALPGFLAAEAQDLLPALRPMLAAAGLLRA